MDATRRARLESVIHEELSQVVRTIKDPRVPIVTFTSVELTQDGSQATVRVSILGDMLDENSEQTDQMKDCLAGLASSAGFLRRHLAKALTVRHIPNLIFKEDKGLKNSVRVHELLKEIKKSQS